jgi:ribosomal protein S18 acetylase RimI-like enzyme
MNDILLDNPAWSALTSIHSKFAQGTERVKRYRPDIAPFVAFNDNDITEIDPFINAGETFFIIGDLPVLPANYIVEHEIPCGQMIFTGPPPEDVPVLLLDETDKTDMFNLINSVQPGLYKPDTRLMGNYYGIKQDGKLVAMAGERIKMPGFTELSAICTNPAYTGRGYAQQLIKHLCHTHVAAGIVSYLHVALSNERAVRLYEHMGFEQRRKISFRLLKKL